MPLRPNYSALFFFKLATSARTVQRAYGVSAGVGSCIVAGGMLAYCAHQPSTCHVELDDSIVIPGLYRLTDLVDRFEPISMARTPLANLSPRTRKHTNLVDYHQGRRCL